MSASCAGQWRKARRSAGSSIPSCRWRRWKSCIQAPRSGFVAAVRTRELGLLLAEAGGARRSIGSELDLGIALHYRTRLGRQVEAGDELARVYLRTDNPNLAERFAGCFEIGDKGTAPDLIVERIAPA